MFYSGLNPARSLRQGRFARGGAPKEPPHVGPIRSQVAGRTDHIKMTVPSGAFVIPADVVSGLGQGNTDAGVLTLVKRLGLTDAQHADGYARGGGIPIMAAGGEYVIAPHDVKRLGKGDMDRGHDLLDRFVTTERAKIIKTMKSLPGPKQRD